MFVEAENAGELMFYGAGAGGAPTASAIMGDTVAIARRLVADAPVIASGVRGSQPALRFDQIATSYWISLRVADESGVLSRIAALFAEHGVSIELLRQSVVDSADGGSALLRIVTHKSTEAALAATVAAVGKLDVVKEVTSVLRVEGN